MTTTRKIRMGHYGSRRNLTLPEIDVTGVEHGPIHFEDDNGFEYVFVMIDRSKTGYQKVNTIRHSGRETVIGDDGRALQGLPLRRNMIVENQNGRQWSITRIN
jgi:hypothetical protein